MIFEAILYALSGFLMKFSDDALDEKHNTVLGIISGVFCVLCIGYLSVHSSDAATIFLAILLGTLFSGKVDKLGHVITLIVFLAILTYFGIPEIGFLSLILCTLCAWFDEIGNDSKWVKRNKVLEFFFTYRFALKIAVLVLSLLGTVQIAYPDLQVNGLNFFEPVTFIFFILFDLAYELAGLKFNRIYEELRNILKGSDLI